MLKIMNKKIGQIHHSDAIFSLDVPTAQDLKNAERLVSFFNKRDKTSDWIITDTDKVNEIEDKEIDKIIKELK